MTALDYREHRKSEAAQLDRLADRLYGPQPWASAALDLVENLLAIAESPGGRLPVLRRGQRDDIPDLTRRLVLRRDNHHCRRCAAATDLQLDHVVPWSQNGPDRSFNLETLCETCNNRRSNYLEADHPRRLIGVTAACDPCLRNHDGPISNLHHVSGLWFGCPLCRAWGQPWEGDQRIPPTAVPATGRRGSAPQGGSYDPSAPV